MTQSIIVAVIIVAAVAWAVWTIIRRGAGGGCPSCDTGSSCPYANKGVCPSETQDEPEVCDEIRQEEGAVAGAPEGADEQQPGQVG